MRFGGAMFLIAVGAILKWAVHKHVDGVNLNMIGLILFVIGIVWLLFELGVWMSRRRTTVVTRTPGATYLDPAEPVDRY